MNGMNTELGPIEVIIFALPIIVLVWALLTVGKKPHGTTLG